MFDTYTIGKSTCIDPANAALSTPVIDIKHDILHLMESSAPQWGFEIYHCHRSSGQVTTGSMKVVDFKAPL